MGESTEQHSSPKQSKGGASLASNKYLWAIGVVILVIVGWFGIKTVISPYEEYKVTLVDGPKEIYSGNNTTYTWRIDGPATTVNTTTVYMGLVSNPGELKKDVKPSDTKYTDFVKDFANGKYDIPLQFVGNQMVNAAGKYYYRVYTLIKDKHYWSDEYSFEAKQMENRVTVLAIPKEIEAGKIAAFTWKVDGQPNVINTTAIYYGLESTPGTLDTSIDPKATKYTDNVKDFVSGKYNIPLQFVGNVKLSVPGTYYYRGHAVIDAKHYWTEEGTFKVSPAGAVEKLTVTEKPAEKKTE
jgi:hypothetical protein